MADQTPFEQFLHNLASARSPAEQAALIAESAFAQLPADLALVARRCIILRWFDETVLTVLVPENVNLNTAEVASTLAQLPFVEQLPWGLAYHEQTRAGLLARYSVEESELLRQAATLAAPAYQNHPDAKLAGQEVLFCLIVAGQTAEASQQLNRLITELRSLEDWNGLLALFSACEQAALLPFVTPLTRTAFHFYAAGLALRRLGKLADAIAAYQQAIALDEKLVPPWNGLGAAYSDQKRYEDAIAAYQQAIALDEKFASSWNGLGNVYYNLNRYDEATIAYKQAVALDENAAWLWTSLGAAYCNLKLYSEAITALKKSITLDDKSAYPWNWMGNVYRAQKQHDKAISFFQQAIALDAQYANPWRNLGLVYRDLKRYDEAIAAFQQAIALDDKFVWPWNELGLVYCDLRRYSEAIAAYQQASTLEPETAYYHSRLGFTLRLVERWAEAEESVRRSLALNPTNRSNWYVLADILRRRGDEQGWRAALAQAQPLIDYSDLYNAACFESVAGNVERALDLLAQAKAAGQFDPAWAKDDPDLHWVRHDPRFWALIGET